MDIVSIDVYNNGSADDICNSCYRFLRDSSPSKPAALTECGNVPPISRQWNAGAKWLWFMPWYDHSRTANPDSRDFASTKHGSCDAEWWREAFSNDFVLTRDKMKALRRKTAKLSSNK